MSIMLQSTVTSDSIPAMGIISSLIQPQPSVRNIIIIKYNTSFTVNYVTPTDMDALMIKLHATLLRTMQINNTNNSTYYFLPGLHKLVEIGIHNLSFQSLPQQLASILWENYSDIEIT